MQNSIKKINTLKNETLYLQHQLERARNDLVESRKSNVNTTTSKPDLKSSTTNTTAKPKAAYIPEPMMNLI